MRGLYKFFAGKVDQVLHGVNEVAEASQATRTRSIEGMAYRGDSQKVSKTYSADPNAPEEILFRRCV